MFIGLSFSNIKYEIRYWFQSFMIYLVVPNDIYSFDQVKVKQKNLSTMILIFTWMKAVVCMCMLVYIHLVYTRQPVQCLHHLADKWPRDGVLRVEIQRGGPTPGYDIYTSYEKVCLYWYFSFLKFHFLYEINLQNKFFPEALRGVQNVKLSVFCT